MMKLKASAFVAASFFSLFLAMGPGCNPQLAHDPAIIDVRPTKLQRGDLLIVEGNPSSADTPRHTLHLQALSASTFRAKSAETRIILEGTFTPPAGDPIVRRIELPGIPVAAHQGSETAERVLLSIDAAVEQQIGRAHFEGKLGVTQKEPGKAPVTFWTGTIEAPLHLSFFQPSMRNLADQAVDWLSNDRMLVWLGIKVRPAAGGLDVTSVTSGEDNQPLRASRAGLQVGDQLRHAGGLDLRSVEDLTLVFRRAVERGPVTLGIKRGGRDMSVTLLAEDLPWFIPTTIIYLGVMLIFGLLVLSVAMTVAGLLTWVERRVAGRMQSRVGPNRVGPIGILQWLADGVKLLLKEDIIPTAVDRPLFKLSPYLVFMGLLGTFVVIPFGQVLIVSDLNVGLLYLLAITGFVAIGLMMAGWSSNNKWALLGGMRSAAQIISYEIPTGLALMVPVVLSGTLSTQTLVEQQGGWPWQWHAFDNPFIFICFFIYFTSALAEGNRTPFDLPEAESELVAGYNIEYSGWRFAVYFLSEWANLFVVGAIATTVFLGGWQIPGIDLQRHASSWAWQLLGIGFFFAKSMTLVFVIIWIRWTLPRFRVDQMMSLCWKYFVPWTFVSVLFQALWIWLAPLPLRGAVQVGTFLVFGMGLLFLFFSRVFYNWSQNPEKFSWKQFY